MKVMMTRAKELLIEKATVIYFENWTPVVMG